MRAHAPHGTTMPFAGRRDAGTNVAGGPPPCGRAGFSLIEVLMAVVILSVILVALAGLTFITAQRAFMLADDNARQGIMLQEVNRLYVAPWATLESTCDSVSSGKHTFERCIRITDVGPPMRQVMIVMTSPRQPRRPDSLSFVRARPLGQFSN